MVGMGLNTLIVLYSYIDKHKHDNVNEFNSIQFNSIKIWQMTWSYVIYWNITAEIIIGTL